MSRSVIYSFLGHFVILGALFALGFTRARPEGRAVYNVSIVPGVAGGPGSGGPGSGGKAAVGVAGMVGKAGAIGAPPSVSGKSVKGTALVEEIKRKPSRKPDSTSASPPDQIAMRVYGTGGTIGGGGSGSGGLGGGAGRPASAFEIAMNNKIVSQWNENLWKAMPDRLSATVKFLIAGDGSVSNVEVFESSGNTGFDQAAARAIVLALMPSPVAFGIPGNLHEAQVTFVNRPD
jgi:TonB family protein